MTTKVKPVAGARQATPQLMANDAVKALSLVLKNPMEEFFEKGDKVTWLRAHQIQIFFALRSNHCIYTLQHIVAPSRGIFALNLEKKGTAHFFCL
jgi:hypothetical protein